MFISYIHIVSYSDSDALHSEFSVHCLSPCKVYRSMDLHEQNCRTVFVSSLAKSRVPYRCYNFYCGKCLPGPAQSDLAPWQGWHYQGSDGHEARFHLK